MPKKLKKLIFSFVIFMAFVFGARSFFIAADTSRPGDRLFGMDQILEKIEVASANSQAAKARLEIDQTDERLREAEQLILGAKPISWKKEGFINTVHAQGVSERNINYHDVRESLSLFQVYLIDAEARISKLKGTSEHEDLLAIMAEMLFLHQEVWESLEDLIPVDLQDAVEQATGFMNKSLVRVVKALPLEKRLALAEKLKSKIPDIESKIKSAASAKESTTFTETFVSKSESSQQITSSPAPQESPNVNIKTGSGSTSVGADTGSGIGTEVEIPAGIDTGIKTCTGLQILGVCMGQGN